MPVDANRSPVTPVANGNHATPSIQNPRDDNGTVRSGFLNKVRVLFRGKDPKNQGPRSDLRSNRNRHLQASGNFANPEILIDSSSLTMSGDDHQSIDYNSIDDRISDILSKNNVDDLINGNDISSILNSLYHNQRNEYSISNIHKITILFLHLLIEDGVAGAAYHPDFTKSLKLSILYTDLRTNEDHACVQALLKHVANSMDENLFIIETLSSSTRRQAHPHATGRILTRNPNNSQSNPLVSVIVNKGYIKNPIARGQYTFRPLTDSPTFNKLRYPKRDAHAINTRLSGRSQVVGNCGMIAFKEALQLATAFQEPNFKKAFFIKSLPSNPFFSLGSSSSLKREFKNHYKIGNQRVHDKLAEILLNKLTEKVNDDVSGKRLNEIDKVADLIKTQKIHKQHRTELQQTLGQQKFETLAPIQNTYADNGADNETTHLINVKTLQTQGSSVLQYLGLSHIHLTDPIKINQAVADLWNSTHGSQNNKITLTKYVLQKSIQYCEQYRGHKIKIALIEVLITTAGNGVESETLRSVAKRIVQTSAALELTEDQNPNRLNDDQIKDLILTLINDNSLHSAHKIMSSLLSNRIREKNNLLALIRKFFTGDPKAHRGKRINQFLMTLVNNEGFIDNLQSHIMNSNTDLDSPLYWYSLAQKFMLLQIENLGDVSDKELQEKKIRSDWATALLHSAEKQLESYKSQSVSDGLKGIALSLKLGAMENQISSKQNLLDALIDSLTNKEGQQFKNAVQLINRSYLSREALQFVDHQKLALKIGKQFGASDAWDGEFSHIARNLNQESVRHVINTVIHNPTVFANASLYTKFQLLSGVNNLLESDNSNSISVGVKFINRFREQISHGLSKELDALTTDEINISYLIKLVALLNNCEQHKAMPIESLISIAQFDSLSAAILNTDPVDLNLFRNGTELLTTYALEKTGAEKTQIFSSIIHSCLTLLASGDPRKISQAAFRMAFLFINPINIDVTTLNGDISKNITFALVTAFSHPEIKANDKYNLSLVFLNQHTIGLVNDSIQHYVSPAFIGSLVLFSYETGKLGGPEAAFKVANLLLPNCPNFFKKYLTATQAL